ncbi:peptidoglycan-binding domain-containing protein [Anabaena sp. FACHB-709]|nr:MULTISPECIES: peptidoglycan-binding protein [Nostocaceae]RUR74739.1 hypothetical protein DSM107007_50170 [Nostoc sp. PCC 7120 = FACHB-418]BAB75629.1 alr3930 [Nostoc sp. PCC 7120 = FACHB-418]
MSDITMLMTGLLMTNQLASSNLPNLSVIQIDANKKNLIESQSYQLLSEAQAKSSDAIWKNNDSSGISATPQSHPQKNRIAKIKKMFAKNLGNFSELDSSASLKNKFAKRKNLIAKRRRVQFNFTKFKKSSFPNSQELARKQRNINNIVIASSQTLTNPISPNLSFSNSGVSVRVLQRLLVANGYPIPVDGVFGPVTEIAVKAFQEQQNLTVDGIVGVQTWYCLTTHSK